MEASRIYNRFTGAVVADFRREYGLSWHALRDLPALEFAVLVNGLSSSSRTVAEWSAGAATVNSVEPRSVDEFVARVQRHRGAVVEVVSRGR